MKIAIIGDMHLGAFQADERREDSFIQAREAIELALKENADLILLAGDIFDTRVPTQDILAKAMEIFHLPKKKYPLLKQEAEIESLHGKSEKEIPRSSLFGIPIVAIHGNHDRRGKGLTNPVELLEKAGLLIHLNVGTIVLSLKGEKIAIHGMSYVPEKYAREVLQKLNPIPVKGATNIFMFHQAVGQYLYSDEEHPTLMLEDLPRGFNLVVDGHIHWSDNYKGDGLNFLLAGSTISTQMRRIEAERPKAIHIFENGKLRQKKLETQRELFYETLTFNEIEPDPLRKKVSEVLSKIPEKNKKPLVRLVLKGTIKHGFEAADLNLHKIEEEFRDRCILHIGREKLFSKETAGTREILEELLKKQISIEERGVQILQKNLAESDFKDLTKIEEFFNTLIENGTDSAYKFLRGNLKK
ncbi:TPA: DNA repair exonuclease [archaeon]|uniref:DNA repair exonuclease n=1 Tax=Candidatus Naiadarchaeum limnaeum TaxID=2756139 RepID=A0A832V4Q7_9ARCH|nr:DNA repair exonuclease [Candidatus Naiadarchaeum limnaeum]